MVRNRPSLSGVLGYGLLGCMLIAGTPFALGATSTTSSPVQVESRSTTVGDSQTGSPQELPYQPPLEDAQGPRSQGGGEAQYQIQLLQQEVQQLRGQVEKLQHDVAQMKSTQEDRYLELDSRFQSLTQRLGSGGGATGDTGVRAPNPDETPAAIGTGKQPGEGEKKIYESALDMIRNRRYDEAIDTLQQIINEYPDGAYTPNAYYWLGEVYAAKPEPDYEKARQALAQVITYFPDNRKVPDAAFKLGKVYNLMGDCERARDILSQVAEQQKGKSVGKLAESYLKENVKCGQ